MDLALQMNLTAAHVAHDVSEFKIAGLTAVSGRLVYLPVARKAGLVRMKIVSNYSVIGADGK